MTNNILIVGGGSAGWMTAATLIKQFPEKNISLIESPNIATIGVGESTQGQFRLWSNWLGIDDKQFLKFTDGSYKLKQLQSSGGALKFDSSGNVITSNKDWVDIKTFKNLSTQSNILGVYYSDLV
jgi:glycine/D-amino acid oxidase-like deaminating enzyme